jgi:hypothetical protein
MKALNLEELKLEIAMRVFVAHFNTDAVRMIEEEEAARLAWVAADAFVEVTRAREKRP